MSKNYYNDINNYSSYGTSSNDPLYTYGLYPQTKYVSPKSLFSDVNVVKPIKTSVQAEDQSNIPVEMNPSTSLRISDGSNGSTSTSTVPIDSTNGTLTQNIVSNATGTGFSSDNTNAGAGEASNTGSSAAVQAAADGTQTPTAQYNTDNLAYKQDYDYNANSASTGPVTYNTNLTPEENNYRLTQSSYDVSDGMSPMAGMGSAGLGTPSSLDNYNNAQANNLNALASDRNIQMWGGLGMGTAQLGLGVMNYLDSSKNNAMNRKVMQQQIDTNNQLMADRKQRNADITSAFGSNGVMSKATGV
jgi:hypothetical protein